MKAISFKILSILFSCVVASAAWASDEEADDSGFSFDDKLAACAACHGENGDKPLAPEYPILAGQYEDYLVAALKAYRDGRRSNPIMTMQVEILELSDSDIEKLAAHFSDKPGLTNLSQ